MSSNSLERQHPLYVQARALEKSGDWFAAERIYGQLLIEQSNHHAALLQRATVLQRLGRPQESLASLDTLLALDPEHALAHCNRAVILQLQGHTQAAVQSYQQALQFQPGLLPAVSNFTLLLLSLGDVAQIEQVMQQALAVQPSNIALRLAWARLLRQWARLREAVEVLRPVLRQQPQHAEALMEVGGLMMMQARYPEARQCYARLLRQQPQNPLALFNLGQIFTSMHQPEAAMQALQASVKADASDTRVWLQLEFARRNLCNWQDDAACQAHLFARLQAHAQKPDAPSLEAIQWLSFELPADLQLKLAQQYSNSISQSVAAMRLPPMTKQTAPPTKAQRILRIGYLSADFRNHAMGGLIHGLFKHHDRTRFEIWAYSLVDAEDEYTASVRCSVDHFVSVAADSAPAIAQRIRADRIDVLIDLMGYTHLSRPQVLAMRPAPLQLHYLGFPGTMGSDFIDGVIADERLIPQDLQTHYRERVHYLPCAFVSSASLTAPGQQGSVPTPFKRADFGLPEQAVVYASFHRVHKLNPPTFDLWLRILQQVPHSVLWMIVDTPLVQQRLHDYASAAGIEHARIIFSPQIAPQRFQEACALADLLLDTSPYSCGATGVSALRAGLPLLTCPGESFASRMGASLCAATGLQELICISTEHYVQQAVTLGQDRAALAALRQRLLQAGDTLPLFQTAAWVQQLEALLISLTSASS